MSATLLDASRVGSLWIPFLIGEKTLIGEVVNVFRRTINIQCTNDMLLSITALNYSSPIHVNVSLDTNGVNFQRSVRPYERVLFENPYIIVGDIKINTDLSVRRIYFPQTCKMCSLVNSFVDNRIFLLNLYNRIYFLTRILDKPNNILELITKAGLEDKVYLIFKKLSKYIAYGNEKSPVLDEIYQLLGLGYGVTPSTDDFIGGLLGTLNVYLACNNRTLLILEKRKILSRTSWVSGYLLYYNHLGLFNNIFQKFLEKLFSRDIKGCIDSFLSLLPIGHTSGLDMSFGALSALAIIDEALSGEAIVDYFFDLFFRNFIVKYRK